MKTKTSESNYKMHNLTEQFPSSSALVTFVENRVYSHTVNPETPLRSESLFERNWLKKQVFISHSC